MFVSEPRQTKPRAKLLDYLDIFRLLLGNASSPTHTRYHGFFTRLNFRLQGLQLQGLDDSVRPRKGPEATRVHAGPS